MLFKSEFSGRGFRNPKQIVIQYFPENPYYLDKLRFTILRFLENGIRVRNAILRINCQFVRLQFRRFQLMKLLNFLFKLDQKRGALHFKLDHLLEGAYLPTITEMLYQSFLNSTTVNSMRSFNGRFCCYVIYNNEDKVFSNIQGRSHD